MPSKIINTCVYVANQRCRVRIGPCGASVTLTHALSRAAGHTSAPVDEQRADELRRRIRLDVSRFAAERHTGTVEIYASARNLQPWQVAQV